MTRADGHLRRAAALALALALAGCAAPGRLYVNPDADMTYYGRIAVLPFDNLSNDRFAAARVTRAFVTELVISERYDVVEPEEFRMALARIGGEPSAQGLYDMAKLKEGAGTVQATGILRGAVTEYQMLRVGSDQVPVVGFDVELIDAATGNIVWRLSTTKKGRGRIPVIGGPNALTLARVTQDACMDAVARLTREAF
jgi:hypothetical protein